MNAEETKAFMKRLAQFVGDNHLKKNANSPQRGMVYEYMDTTRKGQFDRFVQGEALDTMHDGAWFAAALVNAYRTTGDAFYKEFLANWILPFYLKMLNHSDELFTAKRNDARPDAHKFGKEWLFQEGEKGFVPYFWDDGGSASYERRQSKKPLGAFQCVDNLAGKPNPNDLLDGYSVGSSNHMAQDLGVMLQLAWLLFKDSQDEADKKLAAELAEGAKNLYECRMRHHGPIPMCVAPWALASGSAELMKRVPDPDDKALWNPNNHYTRALYDFEPGKQYSLPGFADDQEYRYYFGIARAGGALPKPLAFKTIYDAYTEPMLFRAYCDDWDVPPGINKFDLFPYNAVDGRPADYRSERKGPRGTVKPLGSRFGPQNMICCGWALQALKAYSGIWEERYKQQFSKDTRVLIRESPWRMTADEHTGPLAALLRPAMGLLEVPPRDPVKLGGIPFHLVGIQNALLMTGACDTKQVSIRVFARPDAQGGSAVVALASKLETGGEVDSSVTDNSGERIKTLAQFLWSDGHGFVFKMAIPYACVNGQRPWANGIEHGRFSVQVGKDTRNLYLASLEAQVKAWLERELGCGLRTWEAIFNEKGYIPTSLGSTYDWDKYSDTGGYAHLISAAAQWLLVLEGKSDWEMHKIPAILRATP